MLDSRNCQFRSKDQENHLTDIMKTLRKRLPLSAFRQGVPQQEPT